jgi:hypothetical protein
MHLINLKKGFVYPVRYLDSSYMPAHDNEDTSNNTEIFFLTILA